MRSEHSRRAFFKKLALSGTALGLAGCAGSQAREAGRTGQAQVPRKALGRIGTEVSILGLGLGSVFTRAFRDDEEQVSQVLEAALASGINYWDTARNYGPSERMIGPMVEKHRKDIYLVSKSRVRTYDGFKAELERSLKDLRTDHIDLYHIHNLQPSHDGDLDAIEKGAVRAVREAKEEGIIGHFGITGHSGVGILMEGIRRWDPDALLTVFPADRPDNGAYEEQLLPLALERKMGVVAMKTVRWARNSDLPGTQLVRYGMSVPGICSTIVGLDSMAHLQENVQMASRFEPMDTELRADLSEFVRGELAALEPAPWNRPGYEDQVVT